jgi:hypothetical protein
MHMLDVAMGGIQALRGVENCQPKHVTYTAVRAFTG